jgi:hypothetical protein
MELQATRMLKKMRLKVWIVSDSYITLLISSWTTVSQVEWLVARTLGIEDTRPFRLFEQIDEEFRPLEDGERYA